MRTAEVFRAGKWVPIEFSELKAWDSFKLFETDGTQCVDKDGKSIFVAASDAYLDSTGTLTIDTFRN